MIKTKILNSKIKKDLKIAVDILLNGNLVAFPTETVYGLGAIFNSKSAIEKIYKIKNRPKNNPLIVHVSSLTSAMNVFDLKKNSNINLVRERLFKLSKAFWPGPLTIICEKNDNVSNMITANSNKVAVRMPYNDITLKMISLLNVPVVAPSANLSSRPSPTIYSHVLDTLDGKVDAVLDGGKCIFGIESTIIDISCLKVKVLRLGVIQNEDIENVLMENITCNINSNINRGDLFPGMLNKHYSPNISKITLHKTNDLMQEWINGGAILLKKSSFILLKNKYGNRPSSSITEQMPNTSKDFAKELYAAFYRLEKKNLNKLSIEKQIIDNDPFWIVINDKLIRAAF